jgi:Na+-driven multidrug efflux pump
MLYNIVGRIYIGHIPDVGDVSLTGVGVCLPIIMIVSAFAALVSSAGAPRASIFMGKNDMDSAEKTLGNCFIMQVLISFILTAVLLIYYSAIDGRSNVRGYTLRSRLPMSSLSVLR